MKSRKWLFIAITAMFSAAHSAFAQQCYVSYSPNFSSYATEWADGTYIYTEVGVDGSGIMSTTGSCPNLSSIYHFPSFMNNIGSVSSGYVSGGQYCPDCYISEDQDEELPYDPTGPPYTFTFDWSAEVNCILGGTFFAQSGSNIIGLSIAYWGPPPVIINGQCHWGNLACTGGTTPKCTNVEGFIFVPGCPQYMKSETLILDGNCQTNLSAGQEASGPGPCK
jgi:hypothetical protein